MGTLPKTGHLRTISGAFGRIVIRLWASPRTVYVGAYGAQDNYHRGGFTVDIADFKCLTRVQLEDMVVKYLKRGTEGKKDVNRVVAAADPEFAEKWPAISEYMTSLKYEDGKKRQPSTLTVFAEDSQFKLVLNERDSGQMLWASSDGFLSCLDALEGLLEGDEPPWRARRSNGRS